MPKLLYCSPERRPSSHMALNLVPKDIDMTVFNAPINGRCWKQDCLRRDDLLLMLAKGNKLGYMSFLRQLVNEMQQFHSAAALEERRQRGQGICVSPGTRGWGEFDGWQGIELPTSEQAAFNKRKPQQNLDFSSSCILNGNTRGKTTSTFRWLNCNGPIASWTCSTTPIGLDPVKQTNQKCMVPTSIVPERKRLHSKQPAQWMTIINGKSVPMMAAAAHKPVNRPIGYAPVNQPKSLRAGGVSRERANREAHKALKRQQRSADEHNSTRPPSSSPLEKRIGRRTAHCRTAASTGGRPSLSSVSPSLTPSLASPPAPTSECVQPQLSTSAETPTGKGTPRARSAQTGRFEKSIPQIQYDADGLCVDHICTQDENTVSTEEEDTILMPPPISRPTRQRKPPQRYSSSSLEHWPDVPISSHCKNNAHTGFCASQSANHTPRYYNCLVPFGDKQLFRCPHCDALLLKSEATGSCAFSKCCAKGQVKLERQFYELQRPFLRPAQRQQKDEEEYNQLDDNTKQLDLLLNDLIMGRHPLSKKFLKCVDRYNHEMAFGTATTEQKPVPGGYQPVKMNGMVTYRLSGINPPRNADGFTRDELCGQVWTLNPDDAIDLRKRRNLDAGLHLDNELLDLLHRLMSHPQIGHPLSGLYYHLKRVYEEAQQQQAQGEGPPVDNLRIRLLTRGEVMHQNLPELHNIHPHQLQLPESVDQLAQLFFVDGDDGLPPDAEQGVMLKTRSGGLTVLPWWDNWIDGAICPMLFPCGGSVWKPSLPLAKPDLAAPLPQQPLDACGRRGK